MNQDGPTLPGGAMLQPLVGSVFDYNWGANTTNVITDGSDSPQVITGSGSGSADLVLTLSTLDFIGAGDSAELIWNGQTATDGQSIDFGTHDAATLANDLHQLQVIDTVPEDSFKITFSLTQGVNTTTFNEIFSVACYAAGTRIATPAGETAVEDLQIGDLVLTAA